MELWGWEGAVFDGGVVILCGMGWEKEERRGPFVDRQNVVSAP